MNNLNFGLDLQKHEQEAKRETNYKFGAVTKQVLMPDGDWTVLQPEDEIQKSNKVDFMDCVTESAINCISLILQKKFDIKENWSQRFTAKMSGTTTKGNSLYAVADSIRHDGIVLEVNWPRNQMMSWLEYYQVPYSYVKQKGKKWILEFDVNYEKVSLTREALDKAEEYGPIQVIGYAWEADGNGIYHDYGYPANHAFVRAKKSDLITKLQTIIDSYPTDFIIDSDSTKQEFFKTLAADYQFGDALLYSINLKPADQKSWLYKIMDKFKEVIRDIHGGYWFIKDGKRQSINSIGGILTVIFRQFGILKDNVSDDEIQQWVVTNKFFK